MKPIDIVTAGSRALRMGALAVCIFSFAVGCDSRSDPAEEPAVQHFMAAQEALLSGDKVAAMEALTKSIESRPNGWAYLERAKLYLEQEKDEAAIADCQAGLEIDPENIDLKWLLGEAKKPKSERFKGKNAKPPSAGK